MKKRTCTIAALAFSIITCVMLMRHENVFGPRPIAPGLDRQSRIVGASVLADQPDAERRRQIIDAYGKLPLAFEVNRGQVDPRVKFTSRGHGYSLFLSSTEAVLSVQRPSLSRETRKFPDLQPFPKTQEAPNIVRMRILGANERSNVSGAEELSAVLMWTPSSTVSWNVRVAPVLATVGAVNPDAPQSDQKG